MSLPDLRTEDANVQTIWKSWITELISNYSIDGLRLDSAQQTGPKFLPGFQEAGMYFLYIGFVHEHLDDALSSNSEKK